MFASGITPLTAEKRARAARLAQLIPMLRELRTANPSVVQAYVNTTDSVNVIFPAIDTSSYPASMSGVTNVSDQRRRDERAERTC
ncbi:MAG: hypothetical protein INH41_07010 [Myxococcaceae bacterium]|nr:hypothetical protein [Myxococcaceae bacterium]